MAQGDDRAVAPPGRGPAPPVGECTDRRDLEWQSNMCWELESPGMLRAVATDDAAGDTARGGWSGNRASPRRRAVATPDLGRVMTETNGLEAVWGVLLSRGKERLPLVIAIATEEAGRYSREGALRLSFAREGAGLQRFPDGGGDRLRSRTLGN